MSMLSRFVLTGGIGGGRSIARQCEISTLKREAIRFWNLYQHNLIANLVQISITTFKDNLKPRLALGGS